MDLCPQAGQRPERRYRNSIQGILMTVLEEGTIRTSKASSATHQARCAMLLTSNRLSMSEGKDAPNGDDDGPVQRGAELFLPFDVLSRLDFVANLSNEDDAIRSAMTIAAQGAFAEHREEDDETRPSTPIEPPEVRQIRQIKMLIARIKERIPVVDLSQVEEALKDNTLKLGLVLREYSAKLSPKKEDSFDGDSLLRRLANSLRKIVGALARLGGRRQAERKDVDRAWELLSPKLEVIKWLCGDSETLGPIAPREHQVQRVLQKSEERWLRILTEFDGLLVTSKEVALRLGVTQKTIQREFARREVTPQGGRFQVPLLSSYRAPRADRPVTVDERLVRPPPEQEVEDVAMRDMSPATLRFDDVLPEPPDWCGEVFARVSGLTTSSWPMRGALLSFALREQADPEELNIPVATIVGTLALRDPDDKHRIVYDPLMRQLSDYLKADEWGERARRALMIYAHSFRLTSMEALDDSQRLARVAHQAPPMDPEPQAAWDALVQRIQYITQQEEESIAAEVARREQEAMREYQRNYIPWTQGGAEPGAGVSA